MVRAFHDSQFKTGLDLLDKYEVRRPAYDLPLGGRRFC
jgi:hypothetical protein